MASYKKQCFSPVEGYLRCLCGFWWVKCGLSFRWNTRRWVKKKMLTVHHWHTHTHMVISISLHPEKKLISYFRGAAAENETWHRLMIWRLKTKITTGTHSALLRQISNKRQIVCYYEGDWCLPAGFSGSALSEAAQPPTDTHAPRISQHSQRKTSCHREQRCCVPMFPSSTPPQ